MKKLEKNKGITLIALIITIIVMLILVGVTVNVALNGGLFSKAKEAAVKTNRAVEEEKELEIALEIEMKREDLLKNYNIEDAEWVDDKLVLSNLDICSLYEYILENYYDSSYDKLTLTTAIKATNKLYQICNPLVKDIISENGMDYWNGLGVSEWTSQNKSTEEEILADGIKLYAIYISYLISNDETTTGIDIGNSKYFAIPAYESESNNLLNGIKEKYEMIFPEGSLPFDKISENTSTDLSYIIDFCDGETIILEGAWKLNSENIEYLEEFSDGYSQITNKDEYIGKYAYVIRGVNDYRIGFLCKNTLLIDRKLGEIYYIDDNGIADREIP